MGAYDSLKSLVRQYIKTNGQNEITGQILQNVLIAMIDDLGITIDSQPTNESPNAVASGGVYNAIKAITDFLNNGYYFVGIAGTSTVPDSVTQYGIFYIASDGGTYTNFLNGDDEPLTLYQGLNILYKDVEDDGWNYFVVFKFSDFVDTTQQQSLSSQQKAQARTNIAAVSYDQQSLNSEQQVQAQNNMMGKAYSSTASDHSGLGKVYLQKNNGVLTQSMINTANTVYVIQYDYELAENITIPAGCTLEFDGGSIASGGTGKDTIIGNKIFLSGELTKAIRVNLKGVFLTNRQVYDDIFGSMTDVQKQENSKKIRNSLISSNPGGGWYNTGVAGAFMVGDTNLPKAAICGFSEQTLTSYKGRDSVALYSEVDSLPYVALENGTFSLDHVTFPASVDLHEVVDGNYIDVLYNTDRYTSIVDYVDLATNTIYVKFGGFHNINTGNKEVPPAGSVTYINRITKLWALNTNVVCDNNNNSIDGITGYELGIFLNKENVEATGIDIVSLGRVQPAIAMRASGFLVGLRSSNIPTMIQRLYKVDDSVSYEEDTFNYKMLESWGTKQSDGTYHHIASLDKDFNIDNDYAPVRIKSRNTYLQVNGAAQKIIANSTLYNSEGKIMCHFRPYVSVNTGSIKLELINPVDIINKYYIEIYTDNASIISSFILDVYYVSNTINKIGITPILSSYIDGELMVGYDSTGIYIKRAGTIKSISPLQGASEIYVSASQYPSGVENKYFYKSGTVIPTSNIIPKGFMFFYDTKPIWYTGDTSSGKSGWVDATGTDVPNPQS